MADIDGKCSEDDGEKSFMLFGVKVMTEGSFRKSASMNNLTQFEWHNRESNHDDSGGYDSDDVAWPSAGNRERKRGVPWSEEEHRLFLLGLQKVGKGDWRGISRNYVKTRTPTQVASHAQKYFLRRNSNTRRRRRSSLFDITTDSVMDSTVAEEPMLEDNTAPHPRNLPQSSIQSFPVVLNPVFIQVNQLNNSPEPIRPIPILPPSSKLANLSLNKTTTINSVRSLSLNTSISHTSPQPGQELQPSSQQVSSSRSAFQAIQRAFKDKGGDGIITVA